MGNSNIIVDWISNKSCLQAVALEDWKGKVRSLTASLSQIQFLRIWRECNTQVDCLSKRALQLEEGQFCLSFIKNEFIVYKHVFNMF